MNLKAMQFPLKPFKHTLIGLMLICVFFIYSDMAKSAVPLDINTATAEQLVSVMSGVGRTKAQAIIEYRQQNGDFTKVDDLIFVKGIGPALLEKNRSLLSIGIAAPFEPERIEEGPL